MRLMTRLTVTLKSINIFILNISKTTNLSVLAKVIPCICSNTARQIVNIKSKYIAFLLKSKISNIIYKTDLDIYALFSFLNNILHYVDTRLFLTEEFHPEISVITSLRKK